MPAFGGPAHMVLTSRYMARGGRGVVAYNIVSNLSITLFGLLSTSLLLACDAHSHGLVDYIGLTGDKYWGRLAG